MQKLSSSKFFEKNQGYYVSKLRLKAAALHSHDFFEIELCVKAKNLDHILNGESYPLEPGSIYFINPSDVHAIMPENIDDFEFERYNVMFHQESISENVLASVINSNCACTLIPGELETVCKLFDALIYYQSIGNTKDMSEIGSRIIEAILLTLKIKNESAASELFSKDINQNTRSQVQKILLFIHNNFRQDITLADVADYCSFSPHYVSQLFHLATNTTLTQYIIQLRLDYAKNLLFSTKYSVTEICYKCGFRSFAHFMRSFKKQYGVSPAKYRAAVKADSETQ